MKRSWKVILALALSVSGWIPKAQAGQEVYLSTSPNERYRIYVEQVIERRVGDRIFFRYPVSLVNVKRPDHHFWIMDVGSPLIQETETGTFKVRWASTNPTDLSSIHFDWSDDSLKCFIRLEVLEGVWKTYYVDVDTGKSKDITADLEKYLFEKTKDWACLEPRVQLVQWTRPHLAFFHLTSVCGKSKEEMNNKLFEQKDSVLFDTELGQVVDDCMDCKDEKSIGVFDKYYVKSLPTPTPTPEETPVNQ